MVRTVKIKTVILFASTGLLTFMGENSITASSIENHGGGIPESSYIKGELVSNIRKINSQYKTLLEKKIQNPNEISREDVGKFVDETNKIANKYGSTNKITLEKVWSTLTKEAGEARRDPSGYKKRKERTEKLKEEGLKQLASGSLV
ncbi:hypothetical protein [Pasteuria penetrans]|uniref:hypothetical protein n=1 Tax=Pasteuria penetrans TaxID=86005 RepID=UPI0011EFE201|nr:hypothetical protein [Pasteuria penetrans]